MSDENNEDPDYQLAVSLHKRLNGNNAGNRSQTDEDDDLQFARQLQAQLNGNDSVIESFSSDHEASDDVQQPPKPAQKMQKPKDAYKPAVLAPATDYLNQTQHLVHPEWELVDPNPDVHSMFLRFDEKFFQKRLGAVVLEWSRKMYSCAGICYQRSNAYVKEVTIRLSEPLLKLRPRKDLVETLLHEMIHAYFFMLNVQEGNGGHGPNFKQKMNMINKVAGTNITVYHSFHDEVAAYRTHIWRCTGICQNHTPFMGWVKRTANRAPGPSDQWWEKHQRECGGTFMKVSGPPKPPKPSKPSKPPKNLTNAGKTTKKTLPDVVVEPKNDIREWFKKPPAKKPATDEAVLGAVVPSQPTSLQDRTNLLNAAVWPITKPNSKGANIKSFGNLASNSDDDVSPPKKSGENLASFKDTEKGYTLPGVANADARNIRKIRERRFGQQQKQTKAEADLWVSYDEDVMVRDAPEIMINLADDDSSSDDDEKPKTKPKGAKGNVETNPPNDIKEAAGEGNESHKRRRNNSDSEIQHWESFGDVVSVNLDTDTDDDDNNDDDDGKQEQEQEWKRRIPMSSQERSQGVKREVLADESISFDEGEIVFIDDEYNDDDDQEMNTPAINPMGTVGHSLLLMEFRNHNDVMPSCSSRVNDEENDIVSCPICFDQLRRNELSNHLDGCSITLRVAPPSFKRGAAQSDKSTKKRKAATTKETLRSCGYTDSEIADLNLSSSNDSSMLDSEDELTPRQRRQRSLFKQTVGCPKCGQELMGHQLEAHRHLCPEKKRK